MLNFSSRKFPDLTGCFPDTLKRVGSIPHLLVDCVPFFCDNLSVSFFGVKSDNRNPGDVSKVNVCLLFFHQIYCQKENNKEKNIILHLLKDLALPA